MIWFYCKLMLSFTGACRYCIRQADVRVWIPIRVQVTFNWRLIRLARLIMQRCSGRPSLHRIFEILSRRGHSMHYGQCPSDHWYVRAKNQRARNDVNIHCIVCKQHTLRCVWTIYMFPQKSLLPTPFKSFPTSMFRTSSNKFQPDFKQDRLRSDMVRIYEPIRLLAL